VKPLDEARMQAVYKRRLELLGGDDYAGCMSVTQAAQELGIRRSVLFQWLDGAGWMHRAHDRAWRGTPHALTKGWIVQRGKDVVSWPQITPEGQCELKAQLNLSTDD
jgi:Phage antirepressor protein KilAC domain